MRRSPSRWLALTALLITTSGAATAAEPDEARTVYQALLAKVAEQRGEDDVALANALAAAEATGNADLAKQAFMLASKLRKPAEAGQAALIWAKAEPESSDAHSAVALTHALMFAQGDEPAEAHALNAMEKLLEKVGNNREERVRSLHRLSHPLPPGVAIHFMGALAQRIADPEVAFVVAASIAQRGQDAMLAMMQIDNALDRQPDWPMAIAIKAELLSARNDQAEAVQLLSAAVQRLPSARELRKALGRLQYQQGEYADAARSLEPLVSGKPADPEARFLLAVAVFLTGDYPRALPLLQSLVDTPPSNGPMNPQTAAWLCGLAAERLDKTEQALTCLDKVSSGVNQLPAARLAAELRWKQGDKTRALADLDALPGKVNAEQQLAARLQALPLLIKAGDHQAITQRLESFPETLRDKPAARFWQLRLAHPEPAALLVSLLQEMPKEKDAQPQWLLTYAQLLSDMKAWKQAVALLDAGIQAGADSIDLRYTRAMTAELAGDTDTALAGLRDVIAREPNHVDALNALGYTLADHNRDLDEALDLIQRAQTQKPGNASIADSMGWVLYRRGDLAGAKRWLARAFGQEPEAEISAHYGEVLWKTGDKAGARKVLDWAIQRYPDDAKLNATFDRLNLKKK